MSMFHSAFNVLLVVISSVVTNVQLLFTKNVLLKMLSSEVTLISEYILYHLELNFVIVLSRVCFQRDLAVGFAQIALWVKKPLSGT